MCVCVCAYRHLAAGAVVLDLHVVVLGAAAQLRAVEAQAALSVHLAIRRPRLVVVRAHLPNTTNHIIPLMLIIFITVLRRIGIHQL
jgi:hypothetical protein